MPNLPNPTWWVGAGKYKPEPRTEPSRITSVLSDVLQTFLPRPASSAVAAAPPVRTNVPAEVMSTPVIHISGTGRPAPDWSQWIIPVALGAVTLGFFFAARRRR